MGQDLTNKFNKCREKTTRIIIIIKEINHNSKRSPFQETIAGEGNFGIGRKGFPFGKRGLIRLKKGRRYRDIEGKVETLLGRQCFLLMEGNVCPS